MNNYTTVFVPRVLTNSDYAMNAATCGQFDELRRRLANGADPNYAPAGISILFQTLTSSSHDSGFGAVSDLMALGADPTVVASAEASLYRGGGDTVLHIAAGNSSPRSLALLARHPRVRGTALLNAALEDDVTPLRLAICAASHAREMVLTLVECGADVLVDHITLAAENTSDGTLSSLLSFAPHLFDDPDPETDPPGQTPLMIAAEKGLVSNVRTLLAFGADPGCTVSDGRDSAAFARAAGHAAVAREIEAHSSDALLGVNRDAHAVNGLGSTFCADEAKAERIKAEAARAAQNQICTDEAKAERIKAEAARAAQNQVAASRRQLADLRDLLDEYSQQERTFGGPPQELAALRMRTDQLLDDAIDVDVHGDDTLREWRKTLSADVRLLLGRIDLRSGQTTPSYPYPVSAANTNDDGGSRRGSMSSVASVDFSTPRPSAVADVPFVDPEDVEVDRTDNLGVGGVQAAVYRAKLYGIAGYVIKEFSVDADRFGGVEELPDVDRFEALPRAIAREVFLTHESAHPNVVRGAGAVVDLVNVDRKPRIGVLYPFIPGGSLFRLVFRSVRKADERVPASEMALLLADVARGIAHAHSRGVIHRDVKPKNVMIDDSAALGRCVAVVIDFGVARLKHEGSMTGGDNLVGTPRYKSPEQHRGTKSSEITSASDVFSLGLVAYFVVTAEDPFKEIPMEGLGQQVGTNGHVPEFPEDAADGSRGATWAEIVRIAKRCLAFEPGDRPTAKAVSREFKQASKLGDAP